MKPASTLLHHRALNGHTHLGSRIHKLVSAHIKQQSARRPRVGCQADAMGHMPAWAAREPTWNPSTRRQLNHLMDLFTIADKDGNGVLDRREVHQLLESDLRCLSGICTLAQHHWLTAADLDEILDQYDMDLKGGLSFTQFMDLVLDGVLLDGSMDQYRAMFAAADNDCDGSLTVSELAEVLQQITQRKVNQDEVQRIMIDADMDGNHLVSFPEFLQLFRSRFMDLQKLLKYMKMKIEASPAQLGNDEAQPAAAVQLNNTTNTTSSSSLILVSSEQQLSNIMQQLDPTTLLVAMFGLSGDAMCQATTSAVQDLTAVYGTAAFTVTNIDACREAKTLFKHTLLGRYVPAFFFFQGGQLCHSHADSSAAVLEGHLRRHLPLSEQPVQPVLQQPECDKRQQQRLQEVQQAQGACKSAAAVTAAVCDGEAEPYVMQGYSLADLVYDSS